MRGEVYSPEAPTIINDKGGKQSDVGCRVDLICPKTLIRVGQILDAGAKKYGENNWKQIDIPDHLNHALIHILGYLEGNTDDDHLGHAMCRIMFALSQQLNEGTNG